ncbi:MAG: hypothetical protein CMO81_00900 [Waddliaceae bacterium]|nr:hypothetical protein [Waddliaceae bacterium]
MGSHRDYIMPRMFVVPYNHAMVIETSSGKLKLAKAGRRWCLFGERPMFLGSWGNEANKERCYIELALQRMCVEESGWQSKDHMPMQIKARIVYKITDIIKAVSSYGMPKQLRDECMSALQTELNNYNVDEILPNKVAIGAKVADLVRKQVLERGVNLKTVEILNVVQDGKVLAALLEARLAESNKLVAIKKAEAAAEIEREKQKLALEKAKNAKEIACIEAEAKAETLRIAAKARADANQINDSAEWRSLAALLEQVKDQNQAVALFEQIKKFNAVGKIGLNPNEKVYVLPHDMNVSVKAS